ncbi:hypothetical protein [Photobacterium phosphoreum]|jgi:hypothetical protein|uniref:hypothetical protein n=1 Tax=Photobacterium phosphoreum TaxID=659 RepID=UPI0039AF2486
MANKFIDKETGEISVEPDFVKVYIRDLCNVKGVTGLQMKIFHFMMQSMNSYNEVTYGKSAKERFCSEHNTTVSTFDNNIRALINKQLIERISRGEFRINKKYAVKVDWERVQSITWKTVYTKDGKNENITIEENNDL